MRLFPADLKRDDPCQTQEYHVASPVYGLMWTALLQSSHREGGYPHGWLRAIVGIWFIIGGCEARAEQGLGLEWGGVGRRGSKNRVPPSCLIGVIYVK